MGRAAGLQQYPRNGELFEESGRDLGRLLLGGKAQAHVIPVNRDAAAWGRGPVRQNARSPGEGGKPRLSLNSP